MELIAWFIDIVLHLDRHLAMLVQQYGLWIYGILFVIVFAETGFVVTPFLLGNMVNYQIGRYLGPKVFHWENSRFFNKTALEKTHAFYEKHGGKTLVISRFLPLFRTFAPFVAGIGAMSYVRFTIFNLLGGLGWVVSLCLAGFWFGNMPWVRQNLSLVIIAIIVISLVPVAVGYVRHRAAP
jgi:membrane-associated protein